MTRIAPSPPVGRFAPSPSGPLHFGSLIAALGSFLQARSRHGRWLVRIEDIDAPRVMPGAADAILNTLEQHGLHWDGEVIYQSRRLARYEEILAQLWDNAELYYCECTRRQIQQQGGLYPGTCRHLQIAPGPCAIRLHPEGIACQFEDRLHGQLSVPPERVEEDFILRRRDGLFSYNLVVVVDDIDQGVTEVVRGSDLIEPTPRQIHLYRLLGAPLCDYIHLPVAALPDGRKLSKQNRAPALDPQQVDRNLWAALSFLGQQPPPLGEFSDVNALLEWALQHWQLGQVPQRLQQLWQPS